VAKQLREKLNEVKQLHFKFNICKYRKRFTKDKKLLTKSLPFQIETEIIRQREAKRGSSKTEAQDKSLNLLRVRYVNISISPCSSCAHLFHEEFMFMRSGIYFVI
jgi:hypothetical protein